MARQPRPRASASAASAAGSGASVPTAMTMSSGVARSPSAATPSRSASPIAGSARLPTITGCTNSTATWRTSERAPGDAPTAISRPPRAKRSAIAWQRRATSSARAPKKRLVDARAAVGGRRLSGVMPRRGSRAATPTSQSRTASTPSPVRALARMWGTPGWTASRLASRRSRSKSRWGMRSILFTITSSQARNMSGYLSGLSSPSVTEQTIARASSPTRNSAGQTRLPTFSITSRSISSSGTSGSAERTMLASRWHSPPKPWSVLSWVTVRCRRERRSASRLPATSPSSTPTRTPAEAGQRPLQQRRLARAGGAHQVDHGDARRGRSRRGWPAAIVSLASSAPSTTLTRVRCTMPPPRRRWTRPRSSSPLDRLDVAAARSPGSGTAARAISHSCPQPAQRSRAGTTSISSRAPSQTVPRATMLEVERERSGTTWRSAPTRSADARDRAARRRGARPSSTIAPAIESSCIRPRRSSSRRVSRRAPTACSHGRLDGGRRGRCRHLLDLRRLAGHHDHLARPAAHGLDEPQHGLRIHAVRVDHVAVLDAGLDSTPGSASIT